MQFFVSSSSSQRWRVLEISYFYMFNSIIGYKSVTYETEIHSLKLEP